jgi:hypothetical protein
VGFAFLPLDWEWDDDEGDLDLKEVVVTELLAKLGIDEEFSLFSSMLVSELPAKVFNPMLY